METNLVELMTVYVEPSDGTFYVKWADEVPTDWKLQFQAGFGSMFRELPKCDECNGTTEHVIGCSLMDKV